ncbi:MAG: ester cyclase [Bryobacteraceae bacterium]|nr:ester cyclase [Bryobacteraceae bacterium]
MTEQELNKQRIRDLLAAVDAGDLDKALAFYSPDYFDHDRSEARAAGDTHRAALEHAFRVFSAAFSDTRHRIDDLLADGDRVAARISVEARHTGEVFGIPPTGRVIRNDSLVIYRFQQGLLRERWCRERHSTRSLLLETEAAS